MDAQLVQQALVKCLSSHDATTRTSAEDFLATCQHHHGYAPLLVAIGTNNSSAVAGAGAAQASVDVGTRQLALVLLKRLVKTLWCPAAGTDDTTPTQQQQISDADKQAVRAAILPGLADAAPKLRTATAMAITAVAKFDFPEHWPALMPALVSLLQGNGVPGDAEASARAVAGSLRCLSLLADEVDDTQVELYAPALLPELCAIANGSRGHGSEARRRAFSVLRTFIGTLGLMASQKENRAKAESMLAPTLPAWLAAMTAVLATPRADDGDHAAVALQLEVLRSLTALTMSFSKVIKAPDTQAALQAAWVLFCGSADGHVSGQVVVADDDAEAEADDAYVDSDGDEVGTETILAQLFELFTTLVGGSSHYRKVLIGTCTSSALAAASQSVHASATVPGSAPWSLAAAATQAAGYQTTPIAALLATSMRYMLLPRRAELAWMGDVGKFVADDDNDLSWTARCGAEELMDGISDRCGIVGRAAIASAAGASFSTGAASSAAGRDAWKPREAAYRALGTVAESFTEAYEKGERFLDVPSLLRGPVMVDANGGSDVHPLLRARAIWLGARYASACPLDAAGGLLAAAAAGCQPGQSGPVVMASLRCAAALLGNLAPHMAMHAKGQPPSAAPRDAAEAAVDRAALFDNLTNQVVPALVTGTCSVIAHARQQSAASSVCSPGGALDALASAAADNNESESAQAVLQLAMEALAAFVAASPLAAERMHMQIVPSVLQLWSESHADPFLNRECLSCFEAFLGFPNCTLGCVEAAAPGVVSMLERVVANDGSSSGSMSAESALDLASKMLVKCTPGSPAARRAFDALFRPVSAVCLASADEQVLQGCGRCLRMLAAAPGGDAGDASLLEAWGASAGDQQAAQTLVQCAAKLLGESVGDPGALTAGPLLTAVLRRCPHVLVGSAGGGAVGAAALVAAVLRRMRKASMPRLIISLLLVGIRLLLTYDSVSTFVDAATPDGLGFFLGVWSEWHGSISGTHETAMACHALAKVLMSGDERALTQVTVKGPEISQPAPGGGGGGGGRIATRSRTRASGGVRYMQIPFMAKAAELLAGHLAEEKQSAALRASAKHGSVGFPGDEEEEWETDDDDDDDDNDDEDDDGDDGVVVASDAVLRSDGGPYAPADLLEHLLEVAGGMDDEDDDKGASTDALMTVDSVGLARSALVAWCQRLGDESSVMAIASHWEGESQMALRDCVVGQS